jgi:hypothetical protein
MEEFDFADMAARAVVLAKEGLVRDVTAGMVRETARRVAMMG